MIGEDMKTLPEPAYAAAYGAPSAASNLLCLALVVLLAAPATAEVRIVALGDSLTQGYGLPPEEGFVPELEAWLHERGAEDVTVVNAGVSGDTTAGGRARVDWALSDRADGVIVALGGNDLLRGLEPEVTRENLDAILSEIEARGLPALLAGLPAPANYGDQYKSEFDSIFPDLAQKYDAILYPNFLAGLASDLDAARREGLMQEDGIHPNAEGVEAVVEEIGPAVLELVERARG
jgi:acyl-CoA thioesterase I